MTPSRHSASSLNNNNNSEMERRSSSHSLTRSPMVLKPSHWSNEMKEVTLVTARDGLFNFRMVGGSDHGEFPVISEVMPPDTRGVEYKGEAELTTQVCRVISDHPKWKMRPQTSSFYFLNHDKSIQHLLVFYFPIHFAHGRE